ncbi:MAG TPA: hypothetical protein VHX88_02010 [Solirubrobacteraceae bacterium]|jgi:hypothetical protein|nr:hypothetical protein [Solirubrobacteraceae bacterium]
MAARTNSLTSARAGYDFEGGAAGRTAGEPSPSFSIFTYAYAWRFS